MNNNESLQQMMLFMAEGKKDSLYISFIIYTLIFFCSFGMLLIINHFSQIFYSKTILLKTIKIVLISTYLICIGLKYYKYYYGFKNQGPWYSGIYEAYYECPNCKSFAGGIWGKGPTESVINDSNCTHVWKAIYKKDFKKKILKQNK